MCPPLRLTFETPPCHEEVLKVLKAESKNPQIVPFNATSGAEVLAYEFGPFRLDPHARVLLRAGAAIPLTPKVFDILLLLVENSARLLLKGELMCAVWPDNFVEESNLTQSISVLRKALEDSPQSARYIVTVAGRGYRFAEYVRRVPAGDFQPAASSVLEQSGLASEGVTEVRTGRASWLRWLVVMLALSLAFAYLLTRWIWPTQAPQSSSPQEFRLSKLTDTGQVTAAAVSSDGRYVGYLESDGGRTSLWVRQTATGAKVQILAPQAANLNNLAFSPDGEYLYFTREHGVFQELQRVPTLGGLPRLLVHDVDTPVTFSPDGNHFAFMRGAPQDAEFHIIIADLNGGWEKILATRQRPLEFEFAGPAWSPDGKNIAAVVQDYTSAREWAIQIISTADGESREIYRTQNLIGRLHWLPDGKGLLTVISETPSAPGAPEGLQQEGGQIWRIEYPTGASRRLTNDLANYDPCCLDVTSDGNTLIGMQNTLISNLWVAPARKPELEARITSGPPVVRRHSWLPDNKTILYRDIKGDLYTIQRDGGTPALLTPEHHLAISGPSVCGDGRYVVFQSVPEGGTFGIWRMDANGDNPTKLTDSAPPTVPACSADGKWVYYVAERNGRKGVLRIPIEGGDSQSFIPDAGYPMASPKGGFFLYMNVEGQAPAWVIADGHTGARRASFKPHLPSRFGAWAPDESGFDLIITRNGVSNIWRQPLNGGPLQQLTRFSSGRIFALAWSPDSKWLSVAQGDAKTDVIAIQYTRRPPS